MTVTYVPVTTQSTATGTELLSPDQYSNLYQNEINSLLNNNAVPSADDIVIPASSDTDLDIPVSDLANVYSLPYDPNYTDELANTTGQTSTTSSPAYSGVGTMMKSASSLKLYIALAVIGVGLYIFRHRIEEMLDKVTG